jgi:hypothetical protein
MKKPLRGEQNLNADESHLTKALAEAIEKRNVEMGLYADSEVSFHKNSSRLRRRLLRLLRLAVMAMNGGANWTRI